MLNRYLLAFSQSSQPEPGAVYPSDEALCLFVDSVRAFSWELSVEAEGLVVGGIPC